jgi:hypothetical protein|tara:strand:- start:106 stop:414 length:309 start_codon:yes stop_codon:yes gene_type:complete
MNEYQARRELAKQLNPLKDDQYVIGEDEIKYRDLATSMATQINEDKVELQKAVDYNYEVSGSKAGLIAGLVVVFGSVIGVGVMIIKKRNEDYWNDDENEGGE